MYPCPWGEQLLADRSKKPWVSTPSLPLCAPWKDYSGWISPKWCNDRNLLIKWTLLNVNHNDDDTMITLTDTQQLFGIIKLQLIEQADNTRMTTMMMITGIDKLGIIRILWACWWCKFITFAWGSVVAPMRHPIRAVRRRREAKRWEHPKMYLLELYPGPR